MTNQEALIKLKSLKLKGGLIMTDTYRGGYKKALLDLRNFMDKEVISDTKSKKQLKTRITSSLDLLLTDPETLDVFMQYGGECSCRLDMKTQEVKEFFR